MRVARNRTAVPPVRARRPKPAHRNGDVLVESGCAEPVLGAEGVAPLSVAPETFELRPFGLTPEEMFELEMFEPVVGVSMVIFDVVDVAVAVPVSVAVIVAVVLSVGVTLAVALSVGVALEIAVSVTVGEGVVMTTGVETTTASSPQAVSALTLSLFELVNVAIQL